jgi:hypothetical protein
MAWDVFRQPGDIVCKDNDGHAGTHAKTLIAETVVQAACAFRSICAADMFLQEELQRLEIC